VIYPASYDITILQNSTFLMPLRVALSQQKLDSITASGGAIVFEADCHKLEANDKVVITASGSPEYVPCNLDLHAVYYVLSSGLTADTFSIATVPSGTAVTAPTNASGEFYVARPVNLTGFTADADLFNLSTDQEEATFSCVITEPLDGALEINMTPAVSSGLEAGRYGYDVSITSPGGERYYWMQGVATVSRTYSRN
jgi:hypothetical protein